MTIELWTLGKEHTKLLDDGIHEYVKRINRYHAFSLINIDNSKINKKLSKELVLEKEATLILSKLHEKDILITLDERGQSFTSIQFAEKLNNLMTISSTKIIFLIGGSYGIAESVKKKSKLIMKLSSFTFPHQIVRLLFTEQLYRAFSILKNEKYHHE
ncbi:MAG: 23S rRNA (pseudouridine(1915)-N(3))-methyltransferase RlmH [Chitinophagaceae bacterium]